MKSKFEVVGNARRLLLGYSACCCCCLALTACRPAPQPTTAIAVRPECPPATSDSYFFTVDPFQLRASGERLGANVDALLLREVKGLSRMLAEMEVPSLSCGEEQFAEAYRVIGGNVFDPSPVAITATLENSVWILRALRFGWPELSTTIDQTRTLSKEEAQTFAQVVVESKFWTNWINDPPSTSVRDGGLWIIEGRRDNRYQVVRRWSATERPISELGAALVRLARLPRTALLEEPFFKRQR